MYWTDYITNSIYRSDLSGDNVETVVDSQLEVPGSYMFYIILLLRDVFTFYVILLLHLSSCSCVYKLKFG